MAKLFTNTSDGFVAGGGSSTGGGGSGSIGGSTGSTDNAILRADGTGGATVQTSGIKILDSDSIHFPEGSAPSTPASGFVALYAKTDGALYSKDDAGTETQLGIGGGGSTFDLRDAWLLS